jgi:hypothetical protein
MIAVLQDSPQTLDGPIPEVLKQGEIPTAPTSSPYTDATDFYYDHRCRHVVFFVGSRYL